MPLLDDTTNKGTAGDEEILARSVAHPHLFEILVDRYQAAFIRKCEYLLRDERELAPDVVQDAFVKIYLNAGRFKKQEGASFKSWAYKIVVNTCFTALRKLRRESDFTAAIDPELAELIGPIENREFENKLNTDEVLSLLSKLPELLRRTLHLHSVLGKGQEEIAEIEGISVAAVRTRIHRAKKELKRAGVETQ